VVFPHGAGPAPNQPLSGLHGRSRKRRQGHSGHTGRATNEPEDHMSHTIRIGWGTSLTGKTLRTWQCSCGRQGSVPGTDEAAAQRDATAHVNR
jgi:hypothetical protein